MLSRDLLQKSQKIIKKLIAEGHNRFIIYTYGMGGESIQKLLEELDAQLLYIIDNKKYNGKTIFNLEQAKEKDNSDALVLICTCNPEFFQEVRKPLYQVFPEKMIVDLFSESEPEISEEGIQEIISTIVKEYNLEVNFKGNTPIENYTDNRSKISSYVNKNIDASVHCKDALSLAMYFCTNPMEIEADDIFAGRIKNVNCSDMISKFTDELSFIKRDIGKSYDELLAADEIGLFTRSPGAHVIPDYAGYIKNGIPHYIKKIQDQLGNSKLSKKQLAFLKDELLVLTELKNRIANAGEQAGKLCMQTKASRFDRMEKACVNIAANQPQTFYEAIQMLIFLHKAVLEERGSGSISFGRLDQYLYPYYQSDIANGILTKEEAQLYITELWRKISNVEKSWQNVTIGGGNLQGDDLSNELTLMCMNAAMEVACDQPQLSLRFAKNGTKQEVWDKAIDLIQKGLGFPELYNDAMAIPAKQYTGVSYEDASNYGIVGCVEISVGGYEYSHTEAARINIAKLLEVMLNDGICMLTGKSWKLKNHHKPEQIQTYEAFEKWYLDELTNYIEYICQATEDLCDNYPNYWPVPFTSALMNGCIERARDATDCGSRYNNLTLDLVGVASTANSLEAIENIVFKEKNISLEELKTILTEDFKCREDLRIKLENYPKYGNDMDSVDSKMERIVDAIIQTLDHRKIQNRNGKWQAGFYTSYFHATMGELTGATPDGRRAGEALSSSLSPMAGTDKTGQLAVLNSATKIDMSKFANGMVLDMKFLPTFFEKKENRQGLQSIIQTYFELGGMEIQFNVVDKATLIDAKANPYKYPNLVVRVSGFSAYFVDLKSNLQDEIIKRTELAG